MRLIDADKLKDYFMKCLQTTEGKDNTKERYAYMAWLRGVHAIDNAPTVDAVEVVRCKDCKYSIDYYNDGDCYCRHPKYNGDSLLYIQDGWGHYCSYAERKDK